jgi:hypothetical protein
MAIAASDGVEVRRTHSASPGAASRRVAPSSPLRSMLALSAATRAVVAEPQLRSAVEALQREACRLTGAWEATVIALDRTRGTLWTRDDSAMSDEVHRLVTHVAATGQRAVIGHALLEPIGGPPACAVLTLRRRAGERFAADDLALLGALVGGVAATLHRLIERSFRHPVRPSQRAPR